MATWLWILLFVLSSLYSWWIIGYGGAKWVEGWKSFFLIDWLAWDWNAEQIRMYMLMLWLFATVWFVLGLIYPELRGL